jgi:hypothetical protein
MLIAAHAQSSRKVQTAFKETTLKNGLRVITVEDNSAPVIGEEGLFNIFGYGSGQPATEELR